MEALDKLHGPADPSLEPGTEYLSPAGDLGQSMNPQQMEFMDWSEPEREFNANLPSGENTLETIVARDLNPALNEIEQAIDQLKNTKRIPCKRSMKS